MSDKINYIKTQFLIAAPSSNSGKTTVSLALSRLFTNQGLKVQSFKCGPDYIDVKHLSQASKNPCVNLDTFMMSSNHVKSLFAQYSENADIAIVEGVMGLFDGSDRARGSSAEIALLLDIPVVLVINAKAMAYSAAPLIFGFAKFNSSLKIAGVIFNNVSSERHYQSLKDACEDTGVKSYGWISSNENIRIPSRHLGLSISSAYDFENIIETAAVHVKRNLEIDNLLKDCKTPLRNPSIIATRYIKKRNWVVGVAQDEAFNFTYHENLKTLRAYGEVVFFSPIHDNALPKADFIYLSGGYPEEYLKALSGNTNMRNAIFNYCVKGGKLLAECGGLMYLGKQIIDKNGEPYPMAGFFDMETSMFQSKLSIGYRRVLINDEISYKGHEFHYSTYKELSELGYIAEVVDARNKNVCTKIYKKNNVLASYIHFYWGEDDGLLGEF